VSGLRSYAYSETDRNEEAGLYLSAYKAFEHKPPDLIKERVDKEYGAMLRSTLTTISKVNKTDVETLRTTYGVGLILFSLILEN
jgi:hypothetical protein